MIPAIAPQSSFPVNRTASPTRTSELEAVTQPGKSGQAVGQLAKAAIAAAQMDGVELPRNAQGAAASAIARGADPETLFMLQTEETDETVLTAEDVASAETAEIADPSVNIPPVTTDLSAAKEATDDDARTQVLAAYEETSLLLLRPAAVPTDLAVDLVI